MYEKMGKLFDVVVVCVGGGFNVIGIFYDFIEDLSVRLVGVEVGGYGKLFFYFYICYFVNNFFRYWYWGIFCYVD